MDTKHYIALLDVSLSIQDCFEQIIAALNDFIFNLKQRSQNGERIFITICCFSSNLTYLVKYNPVQDVKEFNMSDFKIEGLTALYDSVCTILEDCKFMPSEIQQVFIIVTDGNDNWSRVYNKESMDFLSLNAISRGWKIIHFHTNELVDIVRGTDSISFDKQDDISSLLNKLSI